MSCGPLNGPAGSAEVVLIWLWICRGRPAALPRCPPVHLCSLQRQQRGSAAVRKGSASVGSTPRAFNRSLIVSTVRTRFPAEAIHEYLDVNEWQVAGIGRALDRGKGIAHARQ